MRLLVAEDDVISRLILERKLGQWGYEVVSATNGDEAWKILSSVESPRLAILDWEMPVRDGPAICRALRESEGGSLHYVILLTARRKKEDLVLGMEAGADDFVSKPFEFEELRVRLRAGQRILALQEELIASRDAFRQQALHDSLTGVLNHGAIVECLTRDLARARREGVRVAVVMGDLDLFKGVNDAFGHLAGDTVLVEAARRICGAVRCYDAVGRWGGEEFLAALFNCGEEDAVSLAERIRTEVGGRPIETAAGAISVTVSLGVASSEGSGLDAERLIAAADEACYRAKEAGRNRVERARASDIDREAPDNSSGGAPGSSRGGRR